MSSTMESVEQVEAAVDQLARDAGLDEDTALSHGNGGPRSGY